ncbi:unnamed protein product, partial [Mesorhabditis belari]|uniref:Uncharacterized protein n=1 Tax=Mesorhabditis belari TaxID=2138241 RepID=A0AAF3J3V7_9BILA
MSEILATEYGAKIAVLDINEKGGLDTVSKIEAKGGKAKFWRVDISDAEQMNMVGKGIEAFLGRIDIVICNAAVLYFSFFMELKKEQLQRAINVNIVGTVNTIRAFLGRMERENYGQIVCISSIAGWSGDTYGLAYCPTKFAVRGVMECLQMELRDRGLEGIKCTTICPYFARTPMVLSQGMRPTSTWIPFMSVESCSRRIIDAILKEKVLSFMPNYIHLIPLVLRLFGISSNRSLRDYLNCRYEPSPDNALNKSHRRILQPMPDHFETPSIFWWLLIPSALTINFLAFFSPLVLNLPYLSFACHLGQVYPSLLLATNVFALIAHVGEGIYALLLCEGMHFTFACRFKWFLQTFILGFPSLRLLRKYVKEKRLD